MLKAENVDVYLGGFHVLRQVSLKVEEKEIVALVGSNGAGKTTFVNTVSGIVRLTSGQIWFNDDAIGNLPPYQRVVRGLVQVPEGRRLFPDMTVLENLEMGGYRVYDNSVFQETLFTIFAFFPFTSPFLACPDARIEHSSDSSFPAFCLLRVFSAKAGSKTVTRAMGAPFSEKPTISSIIETSVRSDLSFSR